MFPRVTLHVGLAFVLGAATTSPAATAQSPAHLEQTIPMPGVKGRIDHLAFDPDHQRLFVAALGNDTVEVLDLAAGKVIHTLSGLAEPQGVLYEPTLKHLWIANGRDGTVRIFDGLSFQPIRSISLGDDADNIRRDPSTGRVFVGYGDGALAVFDPAGHKLADIKLDAHPESFQLEPSGNRIFVNVPRAHKVAVIDRSTSTVVASWPTDDAQSNFPMALDAAHARLFIVCRQPAVLLVLDTRSGAIVAKLPTVGDSDDLFFDPGNQRLYASGGEGAIAIYQQQSPDRYIKIAQLEAVKGARTSLLVPSLHKLFLAVRQQGENPAAIRIYSVAP